MIVLPSVTWPSPPMATTPLWRTVRMVVEWVFMPDRDYVSGVKAGIATRHAIRSRGDRGRVGGRTHRACTCAKNSPSLWGWRMRMFSGAAMSPQELVGDRHISPPWTVERFW